MQKLTMEVTKVVDGNAVDETRVAIVASTKSANNLKDELALNRTFIRKCHTEEVFIDRAETEQAVESLVLSTVEDTEIQSAVISHIMKALDGACIFYKPPIKRK